MPGSKNEIETRSRILTFNLMKAAYYTRYGSPEFVSVKEVNIPEPGPGEVLVKVRAATVNRSDYAILKGSALMRLFTGLRRPRRSTPGTDFAGEVVSVGKGVTGYKTREPIFGFNDMGVGSHAEYVIVKRGVVTAPIPPGVDWHTAAASLEAVHYAVNFINKVPLRTGDRVLVNGGTGAIGSALIQLLKVHGAYVTATCRAANMEQVRALGADEVIDFTRKDFTQSKELYDYIFDAVGKSSFADCKHLLKAQGIYSSSELGEWAVNPRLALTTRWSNGKKVIFPVPVRLHESIALVSDLLVRGKFKPLIDRVYPLDEVAEAFRYVGTGEKIGNVILEVAG